MSKYLTIGYRIASIQSKSHLKQAKFAETIGISSSFFSELKNGITKPSMPILLAIEYKYGYRWEWVLTGDGEMIKDPLSTQNREPQAAYKTSDRVLNIWIDRLIRIFEEGDEKKIEAIKSSIRALDPGIKDKKHD
jgi:transcriptional regulator with XRE-family HTH domain